MLGGIASGANAGNKSAEFSHVVREFGGIEHDAHIEEREQNNHGHIYERVQRLTPDRARQTDSESRIYFEHEINRRRKSEQRAGENRRNYAAGIHAQRQDKSSGRPLLSGRPHAWHTAQECGAGRLPQTR